MYKGKLKDGTLVAVKRANKVHSYGYLWQEKKSTVCVINLETSYGYFKKFINIFIKYFTI